MEFLTLTCISLLMIISPGPDFAVVTKTSLSRGRLSGMGVATGISFANYCHVAINLLGIGVIIANSVIVFTVLKILGAIYLIYIGAKGLLTKSNPTNKSLKQNFDPTNSNRINSDCINKQDIIYKNTSLIDGKNIEVNIDPKNDGFRRGFSLGFFTSLINPKACLFYLSFFSVLLSPETPFLTQIAYGSWVCILALTWFAMVAYFFTHPIVSTKLNATQHWIEKIAGIALILLGLHLLITKS